MFAEVFHSAPTVPLKTLNVPGCHKGTSGQITGCKGGPHHSHFTRLTGQQPVSRLAVQHPTLKTQRLHVGQMSWQCPSAALATIKVPPQRPSTAPAALMCPQKGWPACQPASTLKSV